MSCSINYIQKQPLSESEKDRLQTIHIEIFKKAKESGNFRQFEGKLFSLKNGYGKAVNFVNSVNKEYNSSVAKLNTKSPGQVYLSVDVLPLSSEKQEVLFQKNVDNLSKEQVDFFKTVSENPLSEDIIYNLSSKDIILTGSLALSAQGTIYRDKEYGPHDLDFISPRMDENEVNSIILKKYPNAKKIYSFPKKEFKVMTYIIPPENTIVNSIKRDNKTKVVFYNLKNNKGDIVGDYNSNTDGSEESFGEKAIIVDIFLDKRDKKIINYDFKTKDGRNKSISLVGSKSIFDAKDKLNREKDKFDKSNFIKISPKTTSLIKEFLKKIGVNIQILESISVNGVKQDANGVALISQSLIQVVQGKEDVALTEEAMHFAVEIIEQKDPKLFNTLLRDINTYKTFKQVLVDYGKDSNYQTPQGSPDIRKLKKEAIGKVLAEVVVNKSEDLDESPELIAKTQSWWKDIIDFLKGLFLKSGFDIAAMKIISGEEIGTVEDIRNKEGIFLQKESQDELYNKLKDINSQIEKKNEEYYINGKKVARRVTSLVKDWYERRFKSNELTKSEFAKAVDDLKAEKGTAGHSDLEHAFHVFVADDGSLRETSLDDDSYISQLNPDDKDMYILLRNNLQERLKSFAQGTKFLSEIAVHDPKRDLAGTIDFLAITPDGKVSILDWKFMDLNIDKYEDVPWYKVNAWRQQMEQYKIILEKVYNVKPKDFDQTRMIPIKAVYSEGNKKENILPSLLSIKIGDVVVKNITEDYLIPVGLEEEKTGYEEIDALLEKLNALYRKLSDKKVLPNEKVSKAEQLNSLFKAIRQLQMKQNITPLLKQAKLLNKEIQNLIKRYDENWKGKEANSFTDEQINDFYEEIETAENALEFYTTLDTELSFLFQGELSPEDKATKEELRDAADNARYLSKKLNSSGEKFIEDFVAGKEGVQNILTPEKVIKGVSRWFSSTSNLQIKALETLYKKANRIFAYSSMDTLDETKKLKNIKEGYDKWASSKGLTSKNYFDIIKKSNSNELIDEFNPKFFDELQSKINDKDFKWIKENIDKEAHKIAIKEALEEEIQRIKNKARIGTEEEVDREINIEISKAKQLFNISTVTSPGWLLYDIVKKHPNREKWETSEWKELNKAENLPAFEFYKYIRERNEYYRSIGYLSKQDSSRIFLPYIRKGLLEKLVMGGNVSLGEQFLRSVSIDEGDVGYGKIDPLTGRPIDTIPVYFTRKIEGEISEDLFRNMALYNEMAIRYKYLNTIESQARALVNVERNKKAIATSLFGKTVYKDGKLQYTPDNNENAKLVDDMVKAIIYGQKYIQSETFDQLLGTLGDFGERANKKMGIKILPENLSGRQISVNKVITNLNNAFQLNALGLNPLSALSNFLGGSFQSIINAETYFTKSDFTATELWLAGAKMTGQDGKKMIASLEYFLPLTDNYNKEIAKTLSINKLSQENIQEFLMILMRKSDWFVQTTNFYTFLKNSIIQDGKVMNVREYLRNQPEFKDMYSGTSEERKQRKEKFESEVKRLLEEKGVNKLSKLENGELVIPGVDRKSDSVIELRRKVQQLNKDALGNLSEDDLRTINLNIFGKSFMLFKNWIPRLVDVRTGNLKYNSASDAYEWGRMRMLFRVISENVLGSLGNLTNSLQANDKGVDFLRQLYEKKKSDYQIDTGKDLNMSESQFIDLVRKNLKAQITDVVFMLTLLSLYLALKANAPDDDEDEHVKNSYKYMLRATDKIKDELAYFYDPTSFTSLVSTGIFPSVALITNFKKLLVNFGIENYALATGNEELAEKTHVIKYVMKTFPVANQALGILPIFYPELAKDLGIKPQSQARPLSL